jgi:hypothetical protein
MYREPYLGGRGGCRRGLAELEHGHDLLQKNPKPGAWSAHASLMPFAKRIWRMPPYCTSGVKPFSIACCASLN